MATVAGSDVVLGAAFPGGVAVSEGRPNVGEGTGAAKASIMERC